MALSGPMGRTAARGAVLVGISQAVRILLTIASTIVVARILTPEDYGVIAMAGPVTAFLLLFQNLGLSQAAIQARTLTDEQSNTLFWVNMAASLLIMVVLLAISPLVAWFYGDPRPGYVTAASAATVLLSGSAIQHTALLNRELRFGTLSRIEIAAAVMTFSSTVIAALLWQSYWALWLGSFIGALTGRTLTWRSSRWRPTFPITFSGAGSMIRFGGSLTGYNLLNFATRNADNIMIAHFWGAAAIGLYDRCYRLMIFPIQNINAPLSRVMLPILGRLQDEPDRYRRSFLLAFRSSLLAILPGATIACVLSDRLVPFLLGERWAGAAPIFFWLSLAAFFQPIGNPLGWLFVTSRRGGDLLRWGALSSCATLIAFALGISRGAEGVAMAYFFVTMALIPPLLIRSVKGTSIRVRDLLEGIFPLIATCLLTWPIISWLSLRVSIVPLLSVGLVISYVTAILSQMTHPAGREVVTSATRLFWSTVRKRKSASN